MPRFIIHGARGTMPVSGPQFVKYGAHTTCFSLETSAGIVVIDAGTGIGALSDRLSGRKHLPPITILFTHFHLDHIIGLPLFQPLYNPRAEITLMADPRRDDNWQASIQSLVRKPYWPVELKKLGARIRFQSLPVKRTGINLYGAGISWAPVRHPQQCLAYRLATRSGAVVIATDHECGDARLDRLFLEFCRGADCLIYDAQYTPAEYPARHGWGHSTWREGALIARAAGMRELILTHHDRCRTDAQLDRLVAQARRLFPNTRGAREGMSIAGCENG